MNDLVLHPQTKAEIVSIRNSRNSSVLIHGPSGSGKRFITKHLICDLLNIRFEEYDKNPYIFEIGNEEEAINIKQVRDLQHKLKLRVPFIGKNYNRAIIIHNAQNLNNESQNTLLKTLEEPPSKTIIIISTTHMDTLLPTVLSRLANIEIRPVDFFNASRPYSDKNQEIIKTAYNISGGLMGLMNSLLNNENHELYECINTAKKLIKKDRASRMLIIETLSKDKQYCKKIINALITISQAAISVSVSKNDIRSLNRWVNIQDELINYQENEKLNVNTKLNLSSLFLSI